MSVSSVTSLQHLQNGVADNLLSRGGYVRRADGQFTKGRLFGSTTCYALNKKITDPTSNAKFNKNAKLHSQHITSTALIKAQCALPAGLGNKSCGGALPQPLTQEQKMAISRSQIFKSSLYTVDSMAFQREKERFKALEEKPKFDVRWGRRVNNLKQGNVQIDVSKLGKMIRGVNRNAVAIYLAGGSKRWSSVGDAVNAITTLTANSGAALVGPSKDGDSVKHAAVRCAFTLVSLAVLAANGCMWRSIINSLDDGDDAKLVGDLKVTQTVGWYWLMPLFHGVSFAGQVGSALLVDETKDVDVEKVSEAECNTNQTIDKLSCMINSVRHDPAARQMLIEGLNRRISDKYRSNGVPEVWLKLEAAKTPAELKLAIAEFLTQEGSSAGGQTNTKMAQFKREYQLLKLFKLVENNRTEGASDKCDESARMNFERRTLKAHSPLGRLFAKAVFRASGNGKVESVAKLARWIEKQSDISYQERRKASLMNAEGRIKHRYHPQVARHQGGPLSKALFNLGFFVRDFGRNVILSLDTNLARVIRNVVQHLWENLTGTHASATMCQTFGMITGWLIIGAALTALSVGMDAVFGAASGVITDSGSGLGVGFASLTFAYGVCAATAGVITLLAMGLARAGL